MSVGSVVNALAILRHLSEAATPQGVNAIARTLGLSPSSCFNILKTLQDEDFVDFDSVSKAYRLGNGVMRLAGQGAVALPLPQIAAEMQLLAGHFSVAVGLWRVSRSGRLTLVEVALSHSGTRLHLTVGQRVPKYLGALGRCIAAHDRLSGVAIGEALNSARWDRQPSVKQFAEEIREAGERGWAQDEGMALKGVTTVAAAIPDKPAVNYGLTASMFEGQHEAPAVQQIAGRIIDLARRIADRQI